MDKKTTAIIVTIVAVLLCGCPGLFSLFGGALFALISFIPGAEIDVFGSSDPQAALSFGIGMIVAGLVFVLIALTIILLTWRSRGKAKNTGDSSLS